MANNAPKIWSRFYNLVGRIFDRQLRLSCDLVVAGNVITDLEPLGNRYSPGVTKAGRLSCAGYLNGRKVKVYSALRPEQVALRLAVQSLSNGKWGFPEVVAYDQALIVEAWVDGVGVTQSGPTGRKLAEAAVHEFLQGCWHDQRFGEIASENSKAFCYLEDYLLPRLGVWRHLSAVSEFVDTWQRMYEQASLPIMLSHADLSADNVLIETGTNRVIFIDNELLGVGKGWILDPLNSFLRDDFDVVKEAPVPVDRGFVELTWALRKAGSAFDAGEPGRAVELMRAALARFEKGGAR